MHIIDILDRFEKQVGKCNSLGLYKNKIMETILHLEFRSMWFFRTCARTRRVLENENLYIKEMRTRWDEFDPCDEASTKTHDEHLEDGLSVWMYYFIEQNNSPTVKTFRQ